MVKLNNIIIISFICFCFCTAAAARNKWIFEDGYISQYLDHFNTLDNRTFNMTYSKCDSRFRRNKPIFLYITDEFRRTMSAFRHYETHVHEMAKRFSAMLVVVETRFSNHSLPENYWDPDVLKYSTIEQKLEDVIHLVAMLKKNQTMSRSRVVAFGRRYNGNLVTYLRQKYPHIIFGAAASNAPLDIKPATNVFYEKLGEDILQKDPTCFTMIKEAFKEIMDIVRKNDSERLSEALQLCTPQSLSPEDIASFVIEFLSRIQFLYKYDLSRCEDFGRMNGTSLDKIGAFAVDTEIKNCIPPYTLNETLAKYKSEDGRILNETINDLYPKCAQYGQFDASEGADNFIDELIPLSYYTDHLCPGLFGNGTYGERILSSVNRTRERYGGDNPDITRVLFLYGKYSWYKNIGVRPEFEAEDSKVINLNSDTATLGDIFAFDEIKEIERVVLDWLWDV